MRRVLGQCYTVSNDSASMWLVVDTLKKDRFFKLLPFDLAREAEKEGWQLQDIIIWKKDKTLPFAKHGEMRNIFEYLLFFVKTDNFKYYPSRVTDLNIKEWWVKYPERYSPNGRAQTDVWEFLIPVQGSWGNHYIRHFCPLPAKMIDQIIELCSDAGDVVMDPFAGTGAVLAEASKLGRKYIGCDLNDDFRDMFYEYLPTVASVKHEKSTDHEKEVFGVTIQKLRALKWPSAVMKKVRQQSNDDLQNIRGVFIDKSNNETEFSYTFLVNSNNKNTEALISAIAKRPPLTKYGISPRIEFAYSDPNMKPKWEYSWISTHLPPKPYSGEITPFIATDIALNKAERALADTYL